MKHFTPLILLTALVMLSACSKKQTDQPLSINVYGIDQMKYVVKDKADYLRTGTEYLVNDETYYLLEGINASAGQKITLTLSTISKIPPAAMSHNWLLLKPGTDAENFALKSGAARDNNFIAPGMQDQIITQTGLVGGGKSATTNFSTPDKSGEYDYLCTFTGHFTSGMRGVLYVENSTE